MALRRGKDKLLIVDDQAENIWPLSNHLQSEFDVMCVNTGKESLEIAFSENPPDLILLDVVMPEMDGFQVCEKLKADERTRKIPIIFLTGKKADQEQIKGLGLGANDYITKPFSLPVVSARIKSVLSFKKVLDQRRLLRNQLETLNYELEEQVRKKQMELETSREALKRYEEKWSLMMEVKTDEKMFNIAMKNNNGKRFFATTNSLSGAQSEGWADYFRPNPADNNIVRKVSFVKKCTLTDGSNIIIGSGIDGGGGDEAELTRLTIN